MRLTFRAVPSKIELACSMQPLDDAPNRFCFQIRAANHPWRAGSHLLLLQQPSLHQSLDGTVTDPTDPSGFAQADTLRIGSRSFLTGNGIGVPGCGHSVLIPPFSFACAISKSVQHG